MADAIFISYRRDDSEGEAGRLFDDLTRAFGNDAVFMDVAGIKPGLDFRKAIEDNVASCGVLLAIVGPQWATIAGADGKRRLDDSNDFVALEIASALRRDVPVIPVLVHDAKMPPADLLPEGLKTFSYRNSVELSHARWNSDVSLLVSALKSYVQPSVAPSPEPVHANVPVQLPPPHAPASSGVPVARKSNLTAMVGLGVLAAAILIGVLVYALHSPPSASNLQGTWKRTDAQGDSDALGMLVVTGSAASLTIHAYGRCQAPACDWGQQPAARDGQNIVATFSPAPNGSDSSRTALVTAHTAPGGLDVLVQNTFQNPAGPHRNSSHHLFVNAQ